MTTTTFVIGKDQATVASDLSSDGVGSDRLDRWLANRMPEHSRTVIQRWIKEGVVFVNDQPARANYRVTEGDIIRVEPPQLPHVASVSPEDIPLVILYEDQDIAVVNKPAGLVVHPAPGHSGGTLVNAMLHHAPDLTGIGGEIRPGIVHRLDKDTSGVMVVAKNEVALRNLQAQFKKREVEKRYLALAEGSFADAKGRIVAPIGRDPRNRKRMAVILADRPGSRVARPATTEYDVLAQYNVPLQNDLGHGAFTLLQAHPVTGRTHQIRVHFAWLGHPLVGDPIYGLKRQRLQSPRLFLHAAKLAFNLPTSRNRIEFSAPLPDELQQIIDRLEQLTAK